MGSILLLFLDDSEKTSNISAVTKSYSTALVPLSCVVNIEILALSNYSGFFLK